MQDQLINTASKKYKTMLCRHFQKNGVCQLADKCGFAHGEHELRSDGEPLPIQAQNSVLNNPQYQQMQLLRQQMNMVPQANFKTSKCLYFEKGFCKNQQNCMFAHGDTELRSFPYGQQMMFGQPAMMQQMYNQQLTGQYPIDYQQQQFYYQQQMQYQQQQQPQFLYPTIEQIRQQAMIEIVTQMQNILSYDTEAYHKLSQAVQFIVINQQDQANQVVQEVMSDQKRTKEEIDQYTAIFQKTSEYLQQQQENLIQQQQHSLQQPLQ